MIHPAIFAGLTLLTQIGGVAYLLALAAPHFLGSNPKRKRLFAGALFVVLYATLSVASNVIAPQFGRVPLPCFGGEDSKLRMQSPLYCALNRHYVSPELRQTALDLSDHLDNRFPGTTTIILDAGFPFIDGFPLLPHLSHRDGNKLDLAFFYTDKNGRYVPGRTKSPIGYWAFEDHAGGAAQPCDGRNDVLTLRWDMNWFAVFNKDYDLDQTRMAATLNWLAGAEAARVSKILLEPHLKQSLGLSSDKVRFQGCRAARHDDHIHIEIM